MMQKLLKNIELFNSLSDESLNLLANHIKLVKFKKGKMIIQANKTEPYFYILKRGIARAYSDGENQQITFWFGQAGDVLFSFNSYINQLPGYENIELLEDAELYQIKLNNLFSLYQSNLELANWGRKIAERELISTEKRLIERTFKEAKERYEAFMHQSPELAKRVALKHIASYLGVTQVTLSRIRANSK